MSDTLKPQSFETLLTWILQEYKAHKTIFGLPDHLFHRPKAKSPFVRDDLFGHTLSTPIGPAAGPHTQMAQNIVCAWLSGGRFIELKTVQVMDELEIPRPCIDMEDEGYNVEWSQELKLEQSADEYVKAWVLIHLLHRFLDFEGPVGVVFNMSVGYDLKGIQSPTMVRFMDRLADATDEITQINTLLKKRFPQFADLDIPGELTNNVSLSTMHGCPPDEIERIAFHLLVDRGLHTAVKLNPTLLGSGTVHRILHEDCGFTGICVPDKIFAHDLPYEKGLELIRNLQAVAAKQGLQFGVKLSNTLPAVNHRDALPGEEMYMSGRTLYPLTINLFDKLAHEFGGDLNVSFSGGADALNVVDLLACGAQTVTAVTDILKPGGYARFPQYLDMIEAELEIGGFRDLDELAADSLQRLTKVAAEALENPRYKRAYHPHKLPKVDSGLDAFDCITAPCVEKCPVEQDVPGYATLIARGDYDKALALILSRNPLPGITGHICTHVCQTRCTRSDYDEPVAIRALKRFAFENGRVQAPETTLGERKVAIIGSGPSGLAAASFLALNGVGSTIFEADDLAGGMAALAPDFRLPRPVVDRDIERIRKMGVKIEVSHPITGPASDLLSEGFDAVYAACGFRRDAGLGIEGEQGDGVHTALDFLARAKRGAAPKVGPKVLVIGGGNTAIDAARTAQRLIGDAVRIVYRRTRDEMPADSEEIQDLLDEGNVLDTLVSPRRIILEQGRVVALEGVRNDLGDPDADGRRRPMPVPGSEFRIEADTVIVAIGQAADIAFLGDTVETRKNGAIIIDPETGRAGDRLYAGGDVVRGPASIIEACADGRRAAEAICGELGVDIAISSDAPDSVDDAQIRGIKTARARKTPRYGASMLPVEERGGFALVEQTLGEEQARLEAARCLQCTLVCDKCVEVCPNRANYSYQVDPVNWSLPILECRDGDVVETDRESFVVDQPRQILHLDDFCNECGNCATFCVHQGKPYLEKPRLFLREADFLLEEDNAYLIADDTIRLRSGGRESRLTQKGGGWEFANADLRVGLDADFGIFEMELKTAFSGGFSLKPAAEMALIFRGVGRSLEFMIPG